MKSPAVRRVVMFLAMVGSGLILVLLLADERATGPRPLVKGTRQHDEATLLVKGIEQKDWVRVTTKETRLDVMRPVEVRPGVFEERAVYRIEVKEGTPQPDGVFRALDPKVWILDEITGKRVGYLLSDQAEFLLQESVGGDIALNLGSPATDRFTLTGNVQGSLPVGNGILGEVEGETLVVDGDHVEAPGHVRMSLPDMDLAGNGMVWDGATGLLTYESNCEITLNGVAGGRWVVSAPGGLRFTLPPGSRNLRAEGVLQLRGSGGGQQGRVVARRDDGSTIRTEVLDVDGPAHTMALQGSSDLEWHGLPPTVATQGTNPSPGPFRLRAESSVRLRMGDDGALSWFEANGDVEAWSLPGPRRTTKAHLMTANLEVDLVRGFTTLLGDGLLELLEGAAPARVTATRRIHVRTDEAGVVLRRIEAEGDVQCRSRGYELLGDRLDWDLPADYATVDGSCRLSAMGAWLVADHIDLWPEAERFRIVGSTIHVDG